MQMCGRLSRDHARRPIEPRSDAARAEIARLLKAAGLEAREG